MWPEPAYDEVRLKTIYMRVKARGNMLRASTDSSIARQTFRECQEFCVSEGTVKFHGILKLNP